MRNRFPRLSIERLERRTPFAADVGLGEVQLFSEPIEARLDDVPAEIAIVSDAALVQLDVVSVPVSPVAEISEQLFARKLELAETFTSPDRISDFSVPINEIPDFLNADDFTQDATNKVDLGQPQDPNPLETDGEQILFADEALAS